MQLGLIVLLHIKVLKYKMGFELMHYVFRQRLDKVTDHWWKSLTQVKGNVRISRTSFPGNDRRVTRLLLWYSLFSCGRKGKYLTPAVSKDQKIKNKKSCTNVQKHHPNPEPALAQKHNLEFEKVSLRPLNINSNSKLWIPSLWIAGMCTIPKINHIH